MADAIDDEYYEMKLLRYLEYFRVSIVILSKIIYNYVEYE